MLDEEKISNQLDADMPLVSRLLYQMIDEKYRTLLDESSDLMCIADRDGKFIYVNKKLVDSLGYTKKEMLGMHMKDIIADESRRVFMEKTREFFKNGRTVVEDFVVKTKHGGKITGEMSSVAFYDNTGRYCGAKAVFRDRTKLLEVERLEKKYESILEDGINTLDHIIIILDRSLRVKWASTSVQKYFGIDKTEIIGEDMRMILENNFKPLIQNDESFLKNILVAYETNVGIGSVACEILSLGGGENYFIEHWSYPIVHGDLMGGRIEIFRDITERKKSEETLEYYYKKIHAIMEHAVEGIIELKIDNSIEFVNKSFQDMLGYSELDMLNKTLSGYVLPEERTRLVSVKLIRKAREVTFVKKDGSFLYALMSSIPLVFGAQPPHTLCFISDITETKMAALKLRDANLMLRALNDSLLDLSLRDVRTGVYNFRYLNERLSEEIKRAKRYLRPLSIIMIDIDFFKVINDTYGHSYGDVILKDFTDLIKKSVREIDVVVRSGGEEFVVFLSETDVAGALTVAYKIIKAGQSTLLGEEKRKVQLTMSIGIASYPDVGVTDVATLLDGADKAMYQSKAKGRDMITVYADPNKDEKGASGHDDENLDGEALYRRLKKRMKVVSVRNEESILETLKSIVREVDQRQGYDHSHVGRVVSHVEALAKNFSLTEREIEDARRATLLCHLGLLSVPIEVLQKTSETLSKKERQSIERYTWRSAEITADIAFLAPLQKMILSHHERYDGKGYPQQLKGEDIPLVSRMIAIAEVYEALIVSRPYRPKAYSKKEAIAILEAESGKQFDPRAVAHFLKHITS